MVTQFNSYYTYINKNFEGYFRKAAALQSHLLWITDLLVALNQRLQQPNSAEVIQPIMAQVFECQCLIQTLLSDVIALLISNAVLLRRDNHLFAIDEPVSNKTLQSLKCSSLLD